MNEEEIIKRIQCRLNDLKLNYAIDNIDLEAIRGLLDLYNKEKEKNKKLEEVIDMMAEELIQDGIFVNSNVEDVKQYYFKKARGEENG